MSFGTLKHGIERTRPINVAGTTVKRREIYCEVHGFIDGFLVGGVPGFRQKHGLCGSQPQNGAEFATPGALKAA